MKRRNVNSELYTAVNGNQLLTRQQTSDLHRPKYQHYITIGFK